MKLAAISLGLAWVLLAGCDRGPDAVIPPPWHPASVEAPVAPPIATPAILDEPVDTKPVVVRQEPSAGAPASKAEPAAPSPSGGGHGGH